MTRPAHKQTSFKKNISACWAKCVSGCGTPLPLLRSAFPLMQGEVNVCVRGAGMMRCDVSAYCAMSVEPSAFFLPQNKCWDSADTFLKGPFYLMCGSSSCVLSNLGPDSYRDRMEM